jgi:hypothetical protein
MNETLSLMQQFIIVLAQLKIAPPRR